MCVKENVWHNLSWRDKVECCLPKEGKPEDARRDALINSDGRDGLILGVIKTGLDRAACCEGLQVGLPGILWIALDGRIVRAGIVRSFSRRCHNRWRMGLGKRS